MTDDLPDLLPPVIEVPGQLEFPAPNARRTDPETSHQAAADARRRAPTLRTRCLLALIHAGDDGLTDFELGEIVGRQQTSAGKRRGELAAVGLVEFAEAWRPAPSGSMARVWRVTEQGRTTR